MLYPFPMTASLSLLASCDMFIKVENPSHRSLPERKYIGIVMRFSSCIGPTTIKQTCFFVTDTHIWEVVYDLQSCYHEKILPNRGEVLVYLNQSVCQVIGYEESQRTGHTDVILSFHIKLHHMLGRMYEECSLSHRKCMFWTDFPCLHSVPICGLENHLNTASLTFWESPWYGLEAVNFSRVSF